jgi:anti-sigma B factor antagonist
VITDVEIRTEDNVKIIPLAGRLDTYSAPKNRKLLEKTLTEAAAGGASPNLVIEMSHVSFVDSMGLSMLVQALKRARELNGDVRLCSVQQPVRMIFELTRLDKVFEIFVSESEAVQAFSEG